MRDMRTERAEGAPEPRIDIDGVIQSGRRRVWRNRAAGGTLACAAIAVALLVSMLPFGGDDDDPVFSDGLGQRQISYASGSTIHYGDQSIDVSPHEMASYVLADGGFVYTTKNGDVYLTDGFDSEQIGHAGNNNTLVADDTGWYVGWIEVAEDFSTEAVVYNTVLSEEVFRSPKNDGTGPGCYGDGFGLILSAIDGPTAYVCGGQGISVWGICPPRRSGGIRHSGPAVCSCRTSPTDTWPGPFPKAKATPSSVAIRTPTDLVSGRSRPTSSHPAPTTSRVSGPPADGWRTVIVDRAANEEVELAMPAYREWYVMQWIGDDRFTAMGYDAEDYEGAAGDAPELLTCDIAAAACTVVGQTSGGYIIHPDGQDYW